MLSIYRNMFKVPDLRAKIFFTLAMFGVYRLGATIPVPGKYIPYPSILRTRLA